METIGHASGKEPIFRLHGYTLRPLNDNSYWLEREDGEGTGIKKTDFEKELHRIFDKWM